jgi:hypothetical protein
MTKDQIEAEFNRYFEFKFISETNCKLFAQRIAALAIAEEREACAKVCETPINIDGTNFVYSRAAKAIRARTTEAEV